MKKALRFLFLLLLIFALGLGVFSCSQTETEPQKESPKGSPELIDTDLIGDRFDLTNHVLDFIKENFYDDIDYDEADLYTAYGLVASLGKYNYINPIESFFGSSSDGKGFGLIVRNTKYNEHLIDFILEGSPFLTPSNGKQVLRGDEIYAIDGYRLSGLDTSSYSAYLATLPSDEEVVFTMKRGEEKFDVSYTKVDFDFPYCIYINDLSGVPEKFGYICLRTFDGTQTGKVENEFERAVRSFNEDGNEALILDLRGNGGGSGDVLRQVASHLIGDFAANEALVEIHYAKENRSVSLTAVATDEKISTPIYILCDGQTASASEALIGTMKAHGTLTALIGQDTVGKGVAQNGVTVNADGTIRGYITDKGLDEDGEEADIGAYIVQVIIGKYYIYDGSVEGGKYCMHGVPFVPDIEVKEEIVVTPDYSEDPYIRAAIEAHTKK